MCQKEYSVVADVSREQVWKAWSDVSNWNKWDHDIEWSILEGEFENGGVVTLKPRNSGVVRSVIEDCKPLTSFTNATKIKLCGITLATLRFSHFLENHKAAIKITNTIEVTGPCAWIFWFLIGKNIANGFPESLASFVAYAKKS
ncbi:hypothetical protein JST56_06530 [Candidatus Dependentiae bacterium]|nr:hypothetical protein [Candidatus Dependentiae bacterium]